MDPVIRNIRDIFDGTNAARLFTRGDDIFLMDSDGSNQVAVITSSGRDRQPDWKP